MLTDNDKALVERLRDGVPCCDPDTGNGEGSFYIDDANETMCEAADRIEAQAAEIERLREAGNNLGFYAGHEDACDCVKGWARGPCNCGYTEAWQSWRAALGETE